MRRSAVAILITATLAAALVARVSTLQNVATVSDFSTLSIIQTNGDISALASLLNLASIGTLGVRQELAALTYHSVLSAMSAVSAISAVSTLATESCTSCESTYTSGGFCTGKVNYNWCMYRTSQAEHDNFAAALYNEFAPDDASADCLNSWHNFACWSEFKQCDNTNVYNYPCQSACENLDETCQSDNACAELPEDQCTGSASLAIPAIALTIAAAVTLMF